MSGSISERARALLVSMGKAVENEIERLDREASALLTENKRLEEQNAKDCDRIHELEEENKALAEAIEGYRVAALRKGLDEAARLALGMARTYLAEGDDMTTARVVACLRRAMELANAAREAA